MRNADRAVMVACVLGFIVVMATVFNESMPEWCAHPNGSGNWVVQPLCK